MTWEEYSAIARHIIVPPCPEAREVATALGFTCRRYDQFCDELFMAPREVDTFMDLLKEEMDKGLRRDYKQIRIFQQEG